MKRSTLRVLPLVAGLVLALGACGAEDDSSAVDETPAAQTSSTPESSPSAGASEPVEEETEDPYEGSVVVEMSFEGGTASPLGERVQVEVGQQIVFLVTADAPGELHAHTNEELTLEYPAGESELTMVVEQPGVVEVESHELDVTMVQLQVS
jgi:hypothetical protein